jgi:hypothetical protein
LADRLRRRSLQKLEKNRKKRNFRESIVRAHPLQMAQRVGHPQVLEL